VCGPCPACEFTHSLQRCPVTPYCAVTAPQRRLCLLFASLSQTYKRDFPRHNLLITQQSRQRWRPSVAIPKSYWYHTGTSLKSPRSRCPSPSPMLIHTACSTGPTGVDDSKNPGTLPLIRFKHPSANRNSDLVAVSDDNTALRESGKTMST
jgi:hypothetical protein